MGRILKVLGLVVGALIILFIAVLVAVGLLIDPNDYKGQITAAVDDATGRTLTLEGDLELNLFPRLGIVMGAAQLSNAEGFGDAPFARIAGAELRLGLLPLLRRRIEVDRASLSGLRLNLARNAAGTTNWDDLASGGAASSAAPEAPGQSGEGPAVDISVGAIEVEDAEVSWQDALAGENWRLSNFKLEANGLEEGQAFPLSIGFELAGAEVTADVQSSMRARISLADNTYRLDDLRVEIEGEGSGWPGGSGDARLNVASFVANLDEQSLMLDGLTLEMLGLDVSGNFVGENLLDNLSLSGGIEIGDFDPRYVMGVFNQSIETADPDVLKRASARAEFYYGASGMGMRDMALRLDDSSLTGSAGVRGERLEFDLNVDRIDIDRYLPPPADEDEAPAPDEGSVDEIDLPIEPLRHFAANGNLALDQAQFLGMTLTDANFALTAGNGRLSLRPTGTLYGGAIDGEISIQVQGDAARLALRQSLTGVDMAGVGHDYFKTDALEGTGNVRLDLAAVGSKVGDIKRDLDGTASVAVTDGALLGVDFWHEIMQARAVLTGPEVPALEGEPKTPFSRIAVGGSVEDAVLTTDEFTAALPFAALNGTGTIDLLTLELALSANAGLVDGPTLQEDPVLAEYAGRTIPLKISGTLDAPRVVPDVKALLSQAVQSRAQEEVDEAVDEARENLRERARDRLQGLFE
jgi:AsmA protein